MCGGGDLMESPFRKVVFNFGATKNMYPEELLLQYKVDLTKKYTCKQAESVFSHLYTQDDSWCYWISW